MEKGFTKQAEQVLNNAKDIAKKMRHPYVGTEHLLCALRREFTGVAGQVLSMNQVEEEDIIQVIEELISPVQQVKKRGIEFSPRLEYLLDNAYQESAFMRMDKIGTEHLLLAMLKDADCVATRILATLNVNLGKVQEDLLETVGVSSKEYAEFSVESNKNTSGMLEQFGTDLSLKAETGKLDPVIGREEEINRLMQVLIRRTKNNPCLVGEPGVGKTAVVEGLANCIAQGAVPENMKNKRIWTLDLSGMVAGTKFRGEFEERMKKLIREVAGNENIILLLD